MNLKSLQLALALLFFLCIAVCLAFTPEIEDFFAKPKPDDSLKRVLISPDSFEMKPVIVEGYERCKFEGNTLWLSKRACQRETKEVLWIKIDRSDPCWPQFNEFNNRVVRITGTFSKKTTGHGAYCPGGLINISAIELVKERH